MTFTGDLGKLLLRLTLGGLMLFHGIAKLRHGVAGIAENVAAHGLPEVLAYGAYVGELLAPLLIIIGLWTRPAGLVMAFNMLMAIWLVHAGEVFSLAPHGGWKIELPVLYGLGGVALALLGAGRYSASRGLGRLD